MNSRSLRRGAMAVLLLVPATACESLGTGPSIESPSRVILSSSSVAPAFSTAVLDISADRNGRGGRNGPISLETVSKIEVQIESIQLGVTSTSEDSDDGEWVDLQLAYDPATTWFDLRNLGTMQLATVPMTTEGTIERVRLYFGDARVVFTDGTTESLKIPSGKVTVSAAGVTVNQGEDVVISFASGASVKKIIRTGNGLLMPPVFTVGNRGGDDDDLGRDDDDESDDESDDDSGNDDSDGEADDDSGDDDSDDDAGDDDSDDDADDGSDDTDDDGNSDVDTDTTS